MNPSEKISPRVSDQPDAQQIEIWKNMSYQEKYDVFCSIQRQAREMKRAALRQQFPEDSEEEINRKLVKIFLHART